MVASGWCGSACAACPAAPVAIPAVMTAARTAALSGAFNAIGTSLRLVLAERFAPLSVAQEPPASTPGTGSGRRCRINSVRPAAGCTGSMVRVRRDRPPAALAGHIGNAQQVGWPSASQSGRIGFTKWTHRRQAMTGLRRYSSSRQWRRPLAPKRASTMCRPARAARRRIARVKAAIRRFTVNSDLVERSKP